MNGWTQDELPGVDADVAKWENFTADSWGDLEPERGEPREASGEYTGVGKDNPYTGFRLMLDEFGDSYVF